MSREAILESAERLRVVAETKTAARRADLPLRYLRQQAHLTAPASDVKLAEKALAGAQQVAARLLERSGIDAAAVAAHLGVELAEVEDVVAAGSAPAVVLDLEDGVPPSLVAAARSNAVRLAREVDRGRTLCFIRPPGTADARCADDLVTMLLEAADGRRPEDFPIDGIVFPKVRHVHEVEWLEGVLTDIESEAGLAANQVRVCLQIETGWGVLNLPELAASIVNRLAGIILGTVDLSADILLPEVRYRHPVVEWARMAIVSVAGACGVPALDGMTLDFPVRRPDLDDAENRLLILDRMRDNFQDALHSIDTGMSGRWVGHPLQLTATLLAYRSAFRESSIEKQVETLEEFAAALAVDKGAVAGGTGQLLDIGTDRHVRQMLRRATAWGLIKPERARALGLITDREMQASD